MNITRKSTALLAAVALLLVLRAQTMGSGNNASSAAQPDSSFSRTDSTGEVALQTVTRDSIEAELTAKDLLDQEVYDRDQNKIGKVVDIVLENRASALASAFAENNDRLENSMNTDKSSRSAAGMTGSAGPASSNIGADSSRSSGSMRSAPGKSGGPPPSQTSSEPAVVIARGGLLTLDNDLIRAPLSRLSYVTSAQHLTLDASGAEITSLTASKDSRRR